ncbi:RTA1 like protein-domain-containing protein [Fusarium solani]|uniref:RTA1 like protein-domain-containing protein n=1 Tax=Fusarium solani TaxID=169388 RepID=A0A9P9G063_FUSSL|nr:RTA1 like protein-domain-containing protein [Fusarium solani]KAH7230689.1 RTA1 like protein-domain-containing protein [Fusarium solani]
MVIMEDIRVETACHLASPSYSLSPYSPILCTSYYRYEPSVGVNTLFVILFVLTTVLHLVQLWKTRTWYLISLVIGSLCEIIGYISRVVGAKQDVGCWTMGPLVIQSLLILIAPALMAASIYMILGRVILLTDEEKFALIKRQWLTKLFVTGDVISLFSQGAGGGLMASDGQHKLGENVTIAGPFVQLTFFGLFIIVTALYHRRLLRAPTAKASNPMVRWQAYLITLYVIEFIQGNDGSIMKSEADVFIFDGEIGLLLRGNQPITNGLQLLKLQDVKDAERLSSSNNNKIVGDQRC